MLDIENIINEIRSTPDQRQGAIKKMVSNIKLKNNILVYVKNNKGNSDEGLMIFHDSIIAFVKKVYTDQTFCLSTTYESYIFGISKNLWYTRLKLANRMPVMVDYDSVSEDFEVSDFSKFIFNQEKTDILHRVLDNLKKNCKEVLLMWAGGYHMNEIADKLGFPSEGSARKKKFDCFNGLMNWLDANPSIMNELKN